MPTQLWRRCLAVRTRELRGRNRRPRARPGLELLDGRCLLSADVVIQWNQAVLAAIRNEKPVIGFLTRDLAIVQSAIYDAVNAVDHTSSAFLVPASAPADASPVAAARPAGPFSPAATFPTHSGPFHSAFHQAR